MAKLLSFRRPFSTLWPVTLSLALLFMPLPAAAQPLTMTAGLELTSTYRTDCWQPVHLQFRNDGPTAIEGSAVIPLADPRAPAAMRLPLTIPPRANLSATVWAYFPPPVLTTQQLRTGEVPPLAVAEFRGRDGALLTRAQLVGVPLSSGSGKGGTGGSDRGELIIVVGQREALNDELYQASWLIGQLSEDVGVPMAVANVGVERLPRQAAGLRSVKAVALEAVDPESFDLAQREALLEYVRGGGVLVLSAPVAAIARPGTWLHPLLPVDVVGTRMAQEIKVAESQPALKLRETVEIVEAVEARGQVLLRADHYVHAAEHPVGLGKIVFTSFPLNALEPSQPQVALLWERLLAIKQPQWDWNSTHLGEQRHAALGSMIGRKVARWSIAAALTGGYLLLVIAAQVFFAGPSRPKAFGLSLAGALLLSGILVVMGMARRTEQSLQSARLAVIDVSPDGGGHAHETLAYIGIDDPQMSLESADEKVMLRSAIADAGNRPAVRQQPFAVENAGVHIERVERAWEVARPLHREARLKAVGTFGARGLSLEVDNGMGQTLHAPLLVWNRRAIAMEALPVGAAVVNELRVNPRGDFTSGGALTTDEQKRRAQIIRASLQPAGEMATTDTSDPPPLFIAWLGELPDGELIRPTERAVADRKLMAMVRAPLQIAPTPPGQSISVPAAYVTLDPGRLLYDKATAETVASQQPGEWLIAFSAPREIGQVHPKRATLQVRVTLPGHVISVRKGQCADGKPALNRGGAAVGEWSREVGLRQASFECAESDYDEHGRLWLLLEVRPSDASGDATWQIKDLALSFDAADVVAPPKAIALDPTPGPTERE